MRKPASVRLLFLCVANCARSQMAEGLAKSIFEDLALVQSAGSFPSYVHPQAIEALSEIGIDISDQHSKSVHDIDPGSTDMVITLCADEVCPSTFGHAKHLHWPMPDPTGFGSEEEMLDGFRRVRDEIQDRLQHLKNKLHPQPSS